MDDSDQSIEHFLPLKVDKETCNPLIDDSPCGREQPLDRITKTESISKKRNNKISNKDHNDKPTNTMSNYFLAMNREPPKKLGSRPIPVGRDDCLEGLTFVITGILELIERDDAINLIKKHGGKVTTSVNSRTSYVVIGRDAGPAKLDKIKKLNIKTLDDEGLFKLIEDHPPCDSISQINTPKNSTTNVDHVKNQSTLKPTIPHDYKIIKNDNINTVSIENVGYDKSSIKSTNKTPIDSTLWADKYRPTSLKNLVGQHGPNSPANKLLKWLQNWDPLLYGKKKLSNIGKDDGHAFKAVLLSGRPGIGKTTTAILCCKQLNLDYIEFNASDTRNKSLLKNIIKESTQGESFYSFFKNNNNTNGNKHVVIMDEVDGISGNQDRGGLTELVSTIKTTQVPIICICNDRSNQKIKTLSNYCYDLRFQRPRVEQIKSFCSTVVFKEKLSIQPQALSEIIVGADQDIRQVLNRLQMLSTTESTLNYDQIILENKNSYKDSSQNVFEATKKLLDYNESRKMNTNEKMEQFFTDYSIMPLFIQENYLLCYPMCAKGDSKQTFKIYAEICDLLALSTISDNIIRSNQSWNLLPVQGLFSCVIPSNIGSGMISGMINFPQWLGKNSTHGKNQRYLDQLSLHTRVSTYVNKKDFIIDYIPYTYHYIRDCLIDPNCVEDGSLNDIVDFMKHYNLTREDWDLISELQIHDNTDKYPQKIESKVLSTFTRALNKIKRVLPFKTSSITKTSKGVKVVAEELLKMSIDEEDNNSDTDSSSDRLSDNVVPISQPNSRKRKVDSKITKVINKKNTTKIT